jgi:hypothetical protein
VSVGSCGGSGGAMVSAYLSCSPYKRLFSMCMAPSANSPGSRMVMRGLRMGKIWIVKSCISKCIVSSPYGHVGLSE